MPVKRLFCLLLFPTFLMLFSSASGQAVVISSYYNAGDPRDEWSELLVVTDNTDLRGWQFTDNNSTQTTFNTPNIIFASIPLWNNLRGGTIIMIHHRSANSGGTPYPVVQNKNQGYIEVSANDVNFFSGGSFGTAPLFAGNSMNIAGGGDLVELLDPSATFVHALGHKAGTPGSSWNTIPNPKLDHQASLANGEAVYVCPGPDLNSYGTQAPQVGTTFTSSGAALTFGLPNSCTASSTANSDFWRSVRQPDWPAPGLTGTPNTGNTQITLNWTAMADPNPSDGFQGYMILRSTSTFVTPVDGTTYLEGGMIGPASVIKIINSSQTTAYVDNYSAPCTGGVNYRVYAFRYINDPAANPDNVARGRAYNETTGHFGEVNVTGPTTPVTVTISPSQNPVCLGNNVTFTSTAGFIGTNPQYQWKVNGSNAGTNSPTFTYLPADLDQVNLTVTSSEPCASNNPAESNTVIMSVTNGSPVVVTITANANPVCPGQNVTFTANPVNGGTSPLYQWQVNGVNQGSNSSTYTFLPVNGDDVRVIMTSSNTSCATGNPDTSNVITMIVTPNMVPEATITAVQNPVCQGQDMTFNATIVNGGGNPVYQWKVNGTNAGTNSPAYTYMPADGDLVLVEVTSDDPCASPSTVTSNTVVVQVAQQIPVQVDISVFPGEIFCSSSSVTFTAHPVNEGTVPQYQWFLNDNPVGTNSATYSYIPNDNDRVYCRLTSSLACAGPPAYSDTLTMHYAVSVTVSVEISADPGVIFCDNSPVTFTALPENGGANPNYQWFLNGMTTGTNDSLLTLIPNNGDKIYCVVTSSLLCADTPGKSDTLTMVYTSSVPVGITVSTNTGTSVCAGTSVTFQATPQNGGNNPAYLWKVNNTPASSTGNSYTYTPSDGDIITCILLSSEHCVTGNPATSAPITMSVSQALFMSSAISADPAGSICDGTPVTYHSTAVSAGAGVTYDWYLNDQHTGSNDSVLTITPADNDRVYCKITSAFSCVSPNPVFTDTLTVDAASNLTPQISVTADHATMCPDMPIVFHADYSDAGTLPTLEWMIDGAVVQQDTGTVYSTVTLTSSQEVTCRLTCNLPCATTHEAVSVPVRIPQSSDCFLLYLPTAFTPDGDQLNDIFRVVTDSETVTNFLMVIYDRWGSEVFESSDILKGWDGTIKGQSPRGGMYSWKITYDDLQSGEHRVQTGTINLLK